MSLDKDLIKDSLAKNDIVTVLKDLGSTEPKYDIQGNMMFQTVCHGGSKHKLYYYDEGKSFHCYTECGCSYDIYGLVEQVKKLQGYTLSFYECVKYVANVTGKHITSKTLGKAEGTIVDDWEWINKFNTKKIDVELPTYSDKVMDLFLPYPHVSLIEEGISYETLRKFNIGYYIRTERITFPHYNIDGELVGIRGRAMLQEDIDNGKKYMPLVVGGKLYNFQTMFNLYGLHKTKDAIRRLKKCMIFESEKSVLKCEDYYGDDNFSVATGGSQISSFHRDILLDLGVEEVFIAMDKEYEDHESKKAEIYAQKIMKIAKKFTAYMKVYILWDEWNLLELKDSPCDRGKKVLETLMARKYEIKTNEEVSG